MKRTWLYLATAFAVHSVSGAEFKIDCPAEISTSSVRFANLPGTWRAAATAPIYLHNAAPLDGPPEDLGTLMGESLEQTKDKWVTRYPLSGHFPKGKWFTCDYGMLNEISLSNRLPDDTRECTVTGRKGKLAGQNTFDIVCRK